MSKRKPKCSCANFMRAIYIRVGNVRIKIGFICNYCNQYKIFKGPNKSGPNPKILKGDIYIGLNKIKKIEI